MWNGSGACILRAAMKRRIALSVRQPWAELILRGDKTVEFRGRPTRRRGRVYLYASKLPAEATGVPGIAPRDVTARYGSGSFRWRPGPVGQVGRGGQWEAQPCVRRW